MSSTPVPVPAEFLSSLHASRVLVLMETDAQSNVYVQILLDHEQFKKVTAVVASCMAPCTDHNHRHGVEACFMVPYDDEHEVKLRDEVKSYYEPEEIQKFT